MKIMIDTKKDSREEILHVIRFLKTVINSDSSDAEILSNISDKPKNIFEDNTPNVGGSMFSMFDAPVKTENSATIAETTLKEIVGEQKETTESEDPPQDSSQIKFY